jgi:Protein of unknown function (DUF1236)
MSVLSQGATHVCDHSGKANMKRHLAHPQFAVAFAAQILLASAVFVAGLAGAAAQTSGIEEEASERGVAPKLALTPAQRSAIYQEVHKDKSKVAPSRFAAHVGADVPPMIELYTLPDDILANNPETKLYKFTKVDDQIVLVDPTKMRVIAVIGPTTKE